MCERIAIFFLLVIYMMGIPSTKRLLLCPVYEPNSNTNSGSHLFMMVADRDKKEITCICINNSNRVPEGKFKCGYATRFS